MSNKDIERLIRQIESADAVVIGSGAGLSTSAGLTYSGKRFQKYFADFIEKYHIPDMYSGGFYPFESSEEYWAWWSRHIYYNRYVDAPRPVYQNLLDLIKNKDYFILTTKEDGTFNVYEDIKNKLVEKGVPENEIAFIHSANTDTRKAELFAKVRSEQVRFLLGSTQKMGAGTNVQDRADCITPP